VISTHVAETLSDILIAATSQEQEDANLSTQQLQRQQPTGPVWAPLKLLGHYIGLGLNLVTSSQQSLKVSCIALDFVLDTAANINTLNQQVVQELNLELWTKHQQASVIVGPPREGDLFVGRF
jgi:hypothetical protein